VVVGRGVIGRERGEAKTYFSAARAVYVNYFKTIVQGTLQSDCVMLFREVQDDAGWGWGDIVAEICAQSDPPSLKSADFDQYLLITSEP